MIKDTDFCPPLSPPPPSLALTPPPPPFPFDLCVLQLMQDPRQALGEVLANQPTPPLPFPPPSTRTSLGHGPIAPQRQASLTASMGGSLGGEGSSSSSDKGMGGRGEGDCSQRMSSILMRRLSATRAGDQVLRDVQEQYHVHT